MSYHPPHRPPSRSVTPILTPHLASSYAAAQPHNSPRSAIDGRRSPSIPSPYADPSHRSHSSHSLTTSSFASPPPRRSTTSLSATQSLPFSDPHHFPPSPHSPHSPFSPPSPSPSPSSNFTVSIRIRPPHPHEVSSPTYRDLLHPHPDGRSLTLLDPSSPPLDHPHLPTGQPFTFDLIHPPHSTQSDVYLTTARPAVQSVLDGYNATVLAYGQTGTGKTFTMEGFDHPELRGLIPRAVTDLFHLIHSASSPSSTFLVRASYIQIYQEVVSDLLMPLSPTTTNLLIREDRVRGVFVGGLSEWLVRGPGEVMALLKRGSAQRATGSTKSNETSSRSHAVFMLWVEQNRSASLSSPSPSPSPQLSSSPPLTFLSGKLNLVDLAGSERIPISGATGVRLDETRAINQSLSALANVISSLIKHRAHVPYRDSKLTRLLQSSIGGNCRTALLAMVSGGVEHWGETLSTLTFARSARRVENRVEVNEGGWGDDDRGSLLRKYERELVRLRGELKERGESVVDVRRLMRVAEEKRRVEEDKAAALQRVKALSESLMREKAAKRGLEEKIEEMNGRMLVGGGRAREEMEAKLRELEQRWEAVELEKEKLRAERSQSDQYALLVDQQREVIRNLTRACDEKEKEGRVVQLDRDEWRGKCAQLEQAYDRLETRFLRQQQRMVDRGEVGEEEDDEGDRARSRPAQGKFAVIVTPCEDEDSSTRGEEEGDEEGAAVPPVVPIDDEQRQVVGASEDERRAREVRRRRREGQVEEREALIVILDRRMKAMVDVIDGCLSARSTSEGDEQTYTARREVGALKRLIHASVIALRHSQHRAADAAEEEEEDEDEEAQLMDDRASVVGAGKREEPLWGEREEKEPERQVAAASILPVRPTSSPSSAASSSPSPSSGRGAVVASKAMPSSASSSSPAASLQLLQSSMRKSREELARVQQRLQQKDDV